MYANGGVPINLLVARPCAGKDVCLMMPGTAAKFDRLVALAQAERGWTPVVSGPADAYRTIGMQRTYWNTMPYPMAAYPGTSSHGGSYNGVESGAVDIGNWSEVGRAVFFDLARRAGFEPGYFDGTGGKPDEPWHVIDWSPWDAPAFTPTPELDTPSEEDDMLALKIKLPNGEHLATLAPGIFSGLIESDNPEWVKNVIRDDDAWTIVDGDGQLQTLLHKHGVAINCYRLAGLHDLEVQDARTGAWSRGGRWSRWDALEAALGKARAR